MLRAAIACLALVCAANALSCREEREKAQNGHLLGRFIPECDSDGSYHAVQCWVAGCYCAAADGTTIGYTTPLASVTTKMDCRCARDKYDYEQTGLIGLLFSCNDDGSYPPYRCVGSVCFCIDTKGNQLENSASVNIGQLASLHC